LTQRLSQALKESQSSPLRFSFLLPEVPEEGFLSHGCPYKSFKSFWLAAPGLPEFFAIEAPFVLRLFFAFDGAGSAARVFCSSVPARPPPPAGTPDLAWALCRWRPTLISDPGPVYKATHTKTTPAHGVVGRHSRSTVGVVVCGFAPDWAAAGGIQQSPFAFVATGGVVAVLR